MNIASRGATMSVDREQRVDLGHLRTARLERTKATLAFAAPFPEPYEGSEFAVARG